ncbi:cytochrome c oxidase assembly protein COX14 isoform X1 [Equus przewalskii]|uniref:Cytochrome c oxidase assembly protein COX14 isoform X1 n=1 Tax=Equus przewalskii TaxID=9798 RepID=A0ABM2EJR6_EQUPR|nr:uncharacterized protein LOC106783320 isoform X1 [Equus caballus]
MKNDYKPQDSTGLSHRKGDGPGSRKFNGGHQPERRPARAPALVGGVVLNWAPGVLSCVGSLLLEGERGRREGARAAFAPIAPQRSGLCLGRHPRVSGPGRCARLRSEVTQTAAARRCPWRPRWDRREPQHPGDDMPTAKQLADIGYKTFSTSMMLLTVYGGYLCSVRAYHYFQRRSSRRQAAEEQKTSGAL